MDEEDEGAEQEEDSSWRHRLVRYWKKSGGQQKLGKPLGTVLPQASHPPTQAPYPPSHTHTNKLK